MKGYVFTLDAVLGVTLAAGLLASFFAVYEVPSDTQVLHQRSAEDALFLIDAEDQVDGTGDNASVRQLLNTTVRGPLQWRYTLTYYDVDGGGGVTENRSTGYDRLAAATDATAAVRPVLVFDDGDIPGLQQIVRAEVTVGR